MGITQRTIMGRKKTVETNLERHQRAQHAIMLRAGRTALGLSQREFGKLVGVHYSSLARFETGQIRLKPSHIETIIAFLVNSGLNIAISKDIGITIHIPAHIIGVMEAIDGIRIAEDFYKAAELIGL
jgi:transcriptional regulator with XRE-family HTH domain